MCGVCGCGGGGPRIEGLPAMLGGAGQGGHDYGQPHDHGHAHGGHGLHHHHHGAGHTCGHSHDHSHHHHDHSHGHAAQASDTARLIAVEADILSRNDAHAATNRALWQARGILALNLMSSPGSGKTTLLCRTIAAIRARTPVIATAGAPVIGVIEGDQQTANDADRIRAAGAPAIQINTGKGCHLEAQATGQAAEALALPPGAVLMIENVGNLVCPAAFDLGEEARVAILSVTEGDDKPLKYPDMFASADLVIVNKTDLAPYCDSDLGVIAANIARINPGAAILPLSARTGEGMESWLDWIEARRARLAAGAVLVPA